MGRVEFIVGLYGDLNGSSLASESDDRYRNSRSFEAPDRCQSTNNLEEMETVARVVAECGDDMEHVLLNRYPDDEKLW